MDLFRDDSLHRRIQRILDDSIEAKRRAVAESGDTLIRMARCLVDVFQRGGRLFIFGNGGSAADAQHIAAEFVNRFRLERDPLPALALTVDTSVITSIANDYRFEDVFVKQLQALAKPGDAALGISTSGRSVNVVRALEWARHHRLHTLGWTGAGSAAMDSHCELIVHGGSKITARIQEVHLLLAHLLCELVETMMFGDEVNHS